MLRQALIQRRDIDACLTAYLDLGSSSIPVAVLELTCSDFYIM